MARQNLNTDLLRQKHAQQAQGPENAEDARKRVAREIDRVAKAIQKFRVDGQRFFAGDLPMPPDDLREAISRELRSLQSNRFAGAAEQFRLGSLEAQFNSFVELFGRRLRAREKGEGVARAGASEVRHDPVQGVVIGAKSQDGAVEALYKGLYLRDGTRNPAMDLERFRSYIAQQAETIRSKTGVKDIQFRIAEEDGKLKIKARPIKNA